MDQVKQGTDALFILLGAIMVLAMHAGFAFLELGTVRKKNQVNALVKILVDFAVSTIAYFFVGYTVAYGTSFFTGADVLAAYEPGESRDRERHRLEQLRDQPVGSSLPVTDFWLRVGGQPAAVRATAVRVQSAAKGSPAG